MRRLWPLLVVSVGMLAGCATVGYYNQAARGHLALMASARPVAEWVADPATPEALRERLLRSEEIRRYAAESLGLPDNRSYTAYADLQRPAAVWNVFATPELSLELKTWCYPVLGCAGYRGYFDRAAAEALRRHLTGEARLERLGDVGREELARSRVRPGPRSVSLGLHDAHRAPVHEARAPHRAHVAPRVGRFVTSMRFVC